MVYASPLEEAPPSSESAAGAQGTDRYGFSAVALCYPRPTGQLASSRSTAREPGTTAWSLAWAEGLVAYVTHGAFFDPQG